MERGPAVIGGLGALWQRLSLASRFALAMGVVLIAATFAIGAFVTARIEESVVRNSANATAIFMESVISPISQQLADSETLSPGAQRALVEIFNNTPLGQRVISYKFWRRDGFLIDASNRDLVGQTFALTENLRRAWDGEVMADFEELGDAEDVAEEALGLPLLEIYSPIRAVWSGEVIAVAEFYEVNQELHDDLVAARLGAWGTVSGIVTAIGALLYVIVLGGSRMIEAQRRALDARLEELRDLSDRNTDLRLRVQAAAGRAAAGNERTIRRIGADLHDGPAQHLAYAALRLDALADRAAGTDAADLLQVRDAVRHAMTEVRGLARGLSLPQIAGRPLAEILSEAVEAHALRTGHPVAFEAWGEVPDDPGDPLRIAAFRFVQEALNNASRHAAGTALSVKLEAGASRLRLAVADRGPQPISGTEGQGSGMGLTGLRDRIESLGGTLAVRPRDGGGTELIMTIDQGAAA